jgi:hypothetical protein
MQLGGLRLEKRIREGVNSSYKKALTVLAACCADHEKGRSEWGLACRGQASRVASATQRACCGINSGLSGFLDRCMWHMQSTRSKVQVSEPSLLKASIVRRFKIAVQHIPRR